ncbi:TAXI family TRAP transporter solute-binding subunit [Streptomyces zhaozhouensis]|uniref:TAXI family TRAP transporter solute-binding subunit n=1 Tax=Streptomyces zhaozhouensis TaxID=1300267 RepID=UPI001FEB72B6|nr:TAXI family TRAP transporter solute-binding subunit [Streptomyces zhaozhouensis]
MASGGPVGRRTVPRWARGRRLLVAAGVGLTLALLAVWAGPLVEGDGKPSGTVTLSTGVAKGVYSRYGDLLHGQLANDVPGLDVELRSSEGSVENIERLLAGEADFAIATADSIADYQQRGGEGAERLRACARLYDDYMHLVVPEDSPVERTSDLAGLRVGVGEDQSGVQLVTRELLAAAGLDMERDLTAVRKGIDNMPTMLEAGRLDAFFWSGGLPTSAVEQLSGRTAIRIVPLGDLLPELTGREEAGGATAHYRAAVMPPDAYEKIPGSEGIDTLAVANLLVTTEDADDRLVEEITRSVINGRDSIADVVHAAQRVDLRTAIYTQPLDLHPGAREYYRSVKS